MVSADKQACLPRDPPAHQAFVDHGGLFLIAYFRDVIQQKE